MKTKIALAVLLVWSMVSTLAATESKYIYRVFKLTPNEVAITCINGADPTTQSKLLGSDALIVSCGDPNGK